VPAAALGEAGRDGGNSDDGQAADDECDGGPLRLTNGSAASQERPVLDLGPSLVRKKKKRDADDDDDDDGEGGGESGASAAKRARHLVTPRGSSVSPAVAGAWGGVDGARGGGAEGGIATREIDGVLLEQIVARRLHRTKAQITDEVAQEALYHKDDLWKRRNNLKLLLQHWDTVMADVEKRSKLSRQLYGMLGSEEDDDFPAFADVQAESAELERMLNGVTEASQGAAEGLGHWDGMATLPASLLLAPAQREVEMQRESVRMREAELAEIQRMMGWMDPIPSAIAELCETAGTGADTTAALKLGLARWMTCSNTAKDNRGGLYDETDRMAVARTRRLKREQERLCEKEAELERLQAAREDEEVRRQTGLLLLRSKRPRPHLLTQPALPHTALLPPHARCPAVELAPVARAGGAGHRQGAVGARARGRQRAGGEAGDDEVEGAAGGAELHLRPDARVRPEPAQGQPHIAAERGQGAVRPSASLACEAQQRGRCGGLCVLVLTFSRLAAKRWNAEHFHEACFMLHEAYNV